MSQRSRLKLHMGCGEALKSRLAEYCERHHEGSGKPGEGRTPRSLTSRYRHKSRSGSK